MEKEYRGNWYTPSSKENKIPGVLSINHSESRITLKLFSDTYFDGTRIIDNFESNNIISPIILGDIFRPFPDVEITIFSFDGFFTQKYEVSYDVFEITYDVDYLFIGKHFSTEDDIRFQEYWLRYNNLPVFFGRESIFGHDVENFQMKVNNIDRLSADIDSSISIEFLCQINANVIPDKQYLAETKHFIKFSSIQDGTFDQFRKLQSKIDALLYLTLGGVNSLLENYGILDGEKIEIVTLKYDEEMDKNFSHTLFSLSRFDNKYISQKIKNWFDIFDTFEPCISVFHFAVDPFWKKGSKSIFHINFTNSILNVTQAIESFYKKDNSINYQDVKNEFFSKKNEIIQILKKPKPSLSPNQLKFVNNNLRQKGRTKNDIDLVDIIEHFLTENKESLEDIIIEDKFSEFSINLKNLRNTLTHINHDSSDSLPDDKVDLFNVAQSLFVAILMSKIGFSQKEIKRMIRELKWF